MSWIRTFAYQDADDGLKRLYDRVSGPGNAIDNVLQIHSLRPHTLKGHMTLYKSVLHNSNNSLPKWFLESIGIYVSLLNKCEYCVLHHSAGLKRLLKDSESYNAILQALEKQQFSSYFNGAYASGLQYVRTLTLAPHTLSVNDIENMKTKGLTEGEILEINQVCSYFNYVNRTVLGLGVSTKGDKLGLSPGNSEDPGNWKHH